MSQHEDQGPSRDTGDTFDESIRGGDQGGNTGRPDQAAASDAQDLPIHPKPTPLAEEVVEEQQAEGVWSPQRQRADFTGENNTSAESDE